MASAATQAAFQKNLKGLVRDHLHNRISVSPEDENWQSHANNPNINNHRPHLRCLTNFPDDNNNNPNDSSKQARILDRWSAKKAEEIVSTIESHSQAPELSNASHKSSSSSSPENNSRNSDNLSGNSNLGASSLVQMWEARLHPPDPKMNRSISLKSNPISGSSSSSSSPSSSRISAASENSMEDWDSTVPSSRASVQLGRSCSDGGESERVRIVDIIKRLASDTSNDHDQGRSVGEPSLRRNFCASESADQLKAFSVAVNVNSPKIRGRQAISDLLLRMEKERQRELNLIAERRSVSRFPQRGRIQSMLRLRFLQRGMAIQDQQRVQSIRLATASNPSSPHQGSTIISLRSRFSRGVANDGTSSLIAAATSKTGKEIENSIVNNQKSFTLDQVIKNNEQQAASLADDSLSQKSEVHEDAHEETSASSDVTWQGTNSEANNFDPREIFESTPSMNNWDGNETNDEDFGGTDYDWTADIARPRSYWENRRKEWYQEMLTASSDNTEIRQLLERRTVSAFLDSDFREKMEQMIKSHVQIQATQEDEVLEDEDQERMGQFILSFLQCQSHSSCNQQQEEEDLDVIEGGGDAGEEEEEEECVEDREVLHEVVNEEEEEEEESQALIRSPSPFSWNYSHHVVADGLHPSLQTEASNPERRIFPTPNHASNETDLIYDLRRHMEQLQHEMSELRNAMQTCMEMQAKMRNSVKQEVHPVEVAAKNSFDTNTKKRNCCICYEMQVDSFLYRCGHMCTCLKCAHELQWSSGKCPICRAPILDVVRAYIDS